MMPPQPSPAGPHSIPWSAHVRTLQFGSIEPDDVVPPLAPLAPLLEPPKLPDEDCAPEVLLASTPASLFPLSLNSEPDSEPHATIKATQLAMTIATRKDPARALLMTSAQRTDGREAIELDR
jgi:hypothetical protein